jgi:hypothetical protein
MRGNSPVRFGKGPTEKDPSHGHLAGGLFHPEGAPVQQCTGATRPDGPPHRSQRARLPHRAPALGSGVEAHGGKRMPGRAVAIASRCVPSVFS